jgi:GTPase SAR1 family protein
VEFLTKKITLDSGAVLKAQIWDTSGSERYRSITTGHYRSAVGALLVFDLTDRDSFDQLSYWLNCLREHADEHLVVALVGKSSPDFDIMAHS